ncbi:MAG: AraC family transcriptional regulator [Tissierellia bacterium]|nr:AraC family transcriptional regulator [Tissierellia bacterium]
MLKELNDAMDYIDENIMEDLLLEDIFKSVNVSEYNFRKIFYYLSGMTLNEYVKNRRLSEANIDLLKGERVTDIAFKYGYQSLDGFTRAFKKWSGFLPSDIAKNRFIKTFPKLSFSLTMKGGISMKFKIENMPAFNFVGVSKRVPMQFEGVNNSIVELAMSITDEQREIMHSLQNIKPNEIVNVSYEADHQFMKEEDYLTHLIGILTTDDYESDLLDKITVEANMWAVFPNEGEFPRTLQDTFANIYSQWLPSSEYELVDAPMFSFSKLDDDNTHAYSEIWVAVNKK